MLVFGLFSHLNDLHFALLEDGHIIKEEKLTLQKGTLSLVLAEYVSSFLENRTPDCIAIQRGPSSFTNLRVTLAFIQGVAIGWNAKIFAPTFFELIKTAYTIKNGKIIAQHDGNALPGVYVVDDIIGDVQSFTKEDAEKDNFSEKNLASSLCRMAEENSFNWINVCDLEPFYGMLPQYKKITDY